MLSCGRKGPPTLKAYEKPAKPSGLSAIHKERRMILSWVYPGNLRSSIKGFQILRAEGNGFERKAFVESDQSSFADEDFTLDASYKYQVVAENLRGVLSEGSEIVTVVPKKLPPPPDEIRFAVRYDSVEFSWKSSENGSCYNVYKSTEIGKYGDAPLNKEPVCETVFKDYILLPEKPVYYVVTALHNTLLRDEGFPSGELVVKPSDFVPSPPSEPAAVRTEDKVYLVWKESPESWVKGYRVSRKREGEEGFTFVGETKVPAFTDKGANEKKAWYMIKAIGPSVESQPITFEVQ